MKKLKLVALFAALVLGLATYQFLKEISKPVEIPHTKIIKKTITPEVKNPIKERFQITLTIQLHNQPITQLYYLIQGKQT